MPVHGFRASVFTEVLAYVRRFDDFHLQCPSHLVLQYLHKPIAITHIQTMKLSASFVLILASLTNITVGATLGGLMVPRTADDSTDDCANLGGPMPKSNLPDGVIASDVRKCAAHPLGGGDKDKSPKACQTESDGGCSKGYCWKVCGDNGQWCWTAENGGRAVLEGLMGDAPAERDIPRLR
ncbi:hypothetical protein Hypma_014819 [Hypsizygus marmoreus]|uniref:Uncharacterized protein n=1 Tax=Hypsizygus marmoreus TaxID=39966 RepID=A0A369K7L7_HYPMA|nr:hypothetical protein Hypma_014819 [Hypsizygus marmoreus]